MQPNIVFLDEYSLGDADLGSIRALGNYTGYRTTARDEVADRCREADVVITNKVVFRRETLRQLPRLRLICVAATGMNHIDLEAAAELGIAVKNAVGYSTHAVTETTIGAAIIWGAAQPLGVMIGSWKGFGLCTALGIVTCYLPYLLYTYGLTGLETGKASILASFEPVVATLVGIFVFHEKLTPLSALGCVCVLSAVVLLNLKRRQKANEIQ